MSDLNRLLNSVVERVNSSVKTTAQSLTEAQKTQARENIGAVSDSELDSVANQSAKQSDFTALNLDVNELKARMAVLEEVKTSLEVVSSVDEMVDTTKQYVLESTGTIWEYSEISVDDTDRNLYDPDAVAINANPDGTTRNGAISTDFIPIDIGYADPYLMHVIGLDNSNAGYYPDIYKVSYYNSDKTELSTVYASATTITKNADRDLLLHIGTNASNENSTYRANISYVKLLIRCAGSAITASQVPQDLVITTPEPKITTTSGWADTGVVDEGDTINLGSLALQISQNAENVKNLDGRLTAVEEALAEDGIIATPIIPDYWQSAVDAVIDTVKEKQNMGGKDVVNFAWFSDFHYDGTTDYTGSIPNLCAYIMDACDIPLTLMNGDTLTSGVLSTNTAVTDMLESAMNLFAVIGTNRLMLIRGNHDDVYGSYSDGSTTTYYVNKVAPFELWNKLHRPQAKDFRRAFGGDGTYFYLDNTPQKVRFVCLNSHFYDGQAITSGTVSAMTFGFGSEQLDWLENTALNVEDGWSVVIALHTPPISDYASAFSETDYTDFRSIINASAADIIGIFCGHAHMDRVIENDLPCPIVVITCAINTPYDGTAADRVAGTTTETAIDVVSIDKANRKIYTTRLGIGADREVDY